MPTSSLARRVLILTILVSVLLFSVVVLSDGIVGLGVRALASSTAFISHDLGSPDNGLRGGVTKVRLPLAGFFKGPMVI